MRRERERGGGGGREGDEGGREGREGEDRGDGKRDREPLIMFSAHFFRSITFHMRWCLHGRRKEGRGTRPFPRSRN